MEGSATPGQIRTPDQRLRVFVSSTLGELAAERLQARAAIEQLRLTPVMFELGARPHPPRALYRAYLQQSDLFVAIYWQRYGWVAPDMTISGLEDEYVLSAGKPRLVYVKRPAPEMEPRLAEMLERVQAEDSTSYKPFADAAELTELLVDDLAILLTERFDAAEGAAGQRHIPRSNLPVPASPLIGRDEVLRDLTALFDSGDTRLVTLVGPGGTGKTRLALEIAAGRADRYSDGVFFVDLSSERDPAGAYALIARTVIAEGAGDSPPLEALEKALRDRRALLVLDNFEQVTAAATGVAVLLRHCRGLTVVVTSREALRVRDERVFIVPPLAQSSAVQLFVERAVAMTPDFSITDDNVADVAAICERLDGLPLAIELAAARVNLFGVDELREQLATRLDMLRGGSRDLPERQQTLHNAIGWSNDLLSDSERTVLRLIAVFVGARIGDVDAVARRVPALDGIDVIEALGSLVDKSLVRSVRGIDGRPRFSMLQTIRDYATEQLDSAVDLAEPVRRAHAEHYTERALQLQRALYERERAAALSAMEDELGNLSAAWDYWLQHAEIERLHELLEPFWGFYEARGDYAAAIALGEDLLDALAREPATADRTRLEYALHLSVVRATVAARGFTPQAERRMREALEQSEIVGDARRRHTTLRSLATLHMTLRDFDKAAVAARELVALAEEQRDTTMLSESHLVAGTVSIWREGWTEGLAQIETAVRSFSPGETRAQFRIGPRPEVVSHALAGLVQWQVGFPDRAVAESARALELAADLAHPYSIAYALFHAGLLDLWRADWTAVTARADELEGVADAHDYAVWRALAMVLRGTAMVGSEDADAGLAQVASGFSLYHGLSTPPIFWPSMLVVRAQAFGMAGRREEALACLQEAHDHVGDDDPLSADVAIMRGDLLMGEPSPELTAAEALFEKAASIAFARGARITELAATTRLLEMARGSAHESQARDRVRDLLSTFTEGFAAPPLVAARAALERSN